MANGTEPELPRDSSAGSSRRHPKFWLDDGSIVVRTQDDLFKVHRTLLQRHSPTIARSVVQSGGEQMDGCAILRIPEVKSTDFEALLEHLYHDLVASILRVSSKRHLDFPSFHALARQRLEDMVPSDPTAFFDIEKPDAMLTLAVDYNVSTIQKALFYAVATHAHLQHDEPEGDVAGLTTSQDAAPADAAILFDLSPEITKRCQRLMDDLVAHFTPILFTVATAGHMACTNVFAEQWMPLVIQPALENSGLCRPLETLQMIIDLDWGAQDLCEECVQAKREEWRDEQRTVWKKMDGWLGLEGKL